LNIWLQEDASLAADPPNSPRYKENSFNDFYTTGILTCKSCNKDRSSQCDPKEWSQRESLVHPENCRESGSRQVMLYRNYEPIVMTSMMMGRITT
jgi:hypothetical protein